MSMLFISYHQADASYTRALAAFLRDRGYNIWLDDRVHYGEKWWKAIALGVERCDAFLVIMSPAAQSADWVEREVFLAVQWKKPVLPLLLAGENWPLFTPLGESSGLEITDVREGKMPPESFMQRLANLIPPLPQSGQDMTASPSRTMDVSTSRLRPDLNVKEAMAKFYRAFAEERWQEAYEWLMRLRMSRKAPANFRMDDYEAEVKAKLAEKDSKS